MSVIKAIDISKNLKKKGFKEIRDKDHIFFHYLDNNGRKTIAWTKISHGQNEIGDTLLKIMAAEAQLTKKQFEDLVMCPMSKEEYCSILKKKNIL